MLPIWLTPFNRGARIAPAAISLFHALDIMLALEESSEQGKHIEIESTLDQPLALPAGLPDGVLDM